jgi:hypothetical protein
VGQRLPVSRPMSCFTDSVASTAEAVAEARDMMEFCVEEVAVDRCALRVFVISVLTIV